MWFVVSRKKYREHINLWLEREDRWNEIFQRERSKVNDQAAILKSGERKRVLADLNEALNLVQAYQHALDILSAADPNITRANALLRRWNKAPESKTYLGMRTHADWNEHMGELPPQVKTFTGPNPEAIDRWKQEEEVWGDEAYGSGHVRIDAEVIDEGDNKEPGYTRARIRYVDLEEDELPILAAAKATTKEAGFPEPDTLD